VALLVLTTTFAAPQAPVEQVNPTLTQQVLEALQEATAEAQIAATEAAQEQLRTQAVQTAAATFTIDASAFEETTEALEGNVGATATAVTEDMLGSPTPTLPATPTFAPTLDPTALRGTQVVVTASAAGTAQALPLETAQATTLAAETTLADGVQTLDAAQLAVLLAYMADNGGLVVDEAAGAVVVTYHLTEQTLAVYLDAALFVAGYPSTGLAVDATADGIRITAETITVGEVSGPLTVSVSMSLNEGQGALALGEVTVGDAPLPPELAAQLATQINAALASALTNNLIFDYLVDDAFATEDALVITLVIPFAFPAG